MERVVDKEFTKIIHRGKRLAQQIGKKMRTDHKTVGAKKGNEKQLDKRGK